GLLLFYFKTIVEAPSFLNGLFLIMNDRLTEYPLVINTLEEVQLCPEVHFRVFFNGSFLETAQLCRRHLQEEPDWHKPPGQLVPDLHRYNGFFAAATKMCWSVNRGGPVSGGQL
ncbi:hypothetical protein AAFF_G00170600, partial [Aldrovandia affinis]